MLDQPIRIFAHFKEIGFFFRGLHLPAAVRTFAVRKLALRPERFAGSAVHSLVIALVNIPLIVKLSKNFGDLGFVPAVRGADKFIVRSAHEVPDAFDFGSRLIDVLFGRHARRLRFVLYLLPVLVRARLESDVVAFFALETRYRVRQNRFVRVADMRFARRIRDRRRDVIFRFRLVRLFFACHDFLLLMRKLVSIVIRKYYTPFAFKSKLLLRRFVSGIRQNRLPALFKPFPNSKRTGFGAFGVPRTSACQKSGTKEGGAEKSTIFLNAVSRYYCRKEKERLMTANGQGELRESRLSCARKIRKKSRAFCGQTFAE